MDASRLISVMKTLTTDTVWGELLRPALRALETVRYPAQRFRVLSMADFLTLGVLRHVQRWPALREQVQAVLHLADDEVKRPPLARSTGSGCAGLARAPGGVGRGMAGISGPRPDGPARSPAGDPRAG
jgi:hypothetical protein